MLLITFLHGLIETSLRTAYLLLRHTDPQKAPSLFLTLFTSPSKDRSLLAVACLAVVAWQRVFAGFAVPALRKYSTIVCDLTLRK
jgi:hypothetical protein